MSAMQFGKTDINIQNKIHTMKMTKTKLAKGFTLVELLVVIAIIAALAALSTPVVLKQQKKAAATEAVNNAKQHFILLFEYDQDNGQYPGDSTTMSTGAVAADFKRSIQRVFHCIAKSILRTSSTPKQAGALSLMETSALLLPSLKPWTQMSVDSSTS